jgi:hypothetical protein
MKTTRYTAPSTPDLRKEERRDVRARISVLLFRL